MRLLFVGKRDDPLTEEAAAYVRQHVNQCHVLTARRGDPLPRDIDGLSGEYIISYLSPLIIPGHLLDRCTDAAMNFHPGPPAYPGIGCTNFALYNDETEYGVTCHHMAPAVDTGPIIAVKRFPVCPTDTVQSLTQRCHAEIATLFLEIMALILNREPLPRSPETWTRKPYRRRELEALCKITPEMTSHEVARRVRAVTFPGAPGAFIELHGHRFEYEQALRADEGTKGG